STVRFDHIVANILETARERPIVIQSLFLRVRGQTMPAEELRAYCERIGHILANGGQIKEIHAYTIARPVLEPWVEKLTQGELEEVADTIRKQTGLTVRSFP
ncbi:MAG: radical SAM protein, partial [Verrucomicrobiae bacterium]|nr:radical SAM protein [Verrucomicrobiae bacterium]